MERRLRKNLVDPELTMDKKVERLSVIVERLGRRRSKRNSAIIAPIPISNCITGVEVQGEVLKYMFCCPGVLSKGGIYLDKKPEDGGLLVLKVEDSAGGKAFTYAISKNTLIFEPRLDVDTWTRVTLILSMKNPDKDKITEAWIGLLWTPTIKDTTVKQFLIDDLDRSLDDVSKE